MEFFPIFFSPIIVSDKDNNDCLKTAQVVGLGEGHPRAMLEEWSPTIHRGL